MHHQIAGSCAVRNRHDDLIITPTRRRGLRPVESHHARALGRSEAAPRDGYGSADRAGGWRQAGNGRRQAPAPRLPELGSQENCGFMCPHVAELLINQHQRFLISVGVLPVEFFMNLEKSRRRRNPRVIAMCLILKSRLPVRNVRHISSSFDFLNSRNVTPLASLTDFSMSCRSSRRMRERL